ncbi:Guanosine-diphosphatase [Mortierella sp. GBA30]|nr:Guanosine-diphosphatase [Mortierella sp. GBA30]
MFQTEVESHHPSTFSSHRHSFTPGIHLAPHQDQSIKRSSHISFGISQPVSNEPTDRQSGSSSKLIRRNSLRLAKRLSSASLLPTNYTNKKRSSSSSTGYPSFNKASEADSLYRPSIRFVMVLKDNFMARKGYWLRNGAILAFGLTLFFFVMLPRSQPNLHNNVPIDSMSETTGLNWPKEITSEHCTVPHPERPLIQYVLMIDAGSSGSRIHAYKFNYCKATPELENELFEHIEPGLSSYKEDAEGAAQSLDVLLEAAMKTVPRYLHTSTPVAVKATAGLRMLGDIESERILAAVRHRLETKYPFPIIKEQGVAVMDGSDEGVYAWVTVNYLLERINSLVKTPTVAVLDLGGASTQIAFEPKVVNGHSVAQGNERVSMNFNGNDYTLYQNSYLGYGLNEARKQINNYVIDKPIPNTHNIKLQQNEYLHPCMPINTRNTYKRKVGDVEHEVTMIGVTDPAGECRRVVHAIFYKEKACSQSPCSFNGVYQPSLATAFDSDIYAFSYIFDRISPFRLGSETATQEITLQELETLTDRVCVADETDFREFGEKGEAKEELGKISEMCMDLNYIYSLLDYGYGIQKDRKINLTKKIRNYETGWCLGASISVLGHRWFIGE